MLTMTAITTYFMSCCFYIDACCDEVKYIVRSVDDRVACEGMTKRNAAELKYRSKEIIIFHVKIIR